MQAKSAISATETCSAVQAVVAPVAAPVSAAALTNHSAQSVSSFLQSLGVVSHIDSGSAQWTNAPMLLSELSYLGISTLRDGAPFSYALPTFITLAQAGIHFDILEANVYSFDQTGIVNAALDVSRAHALEQAVPGAIIAFEGTNEYTTNHYLLDGNASWGSLDWGLRDAAALEAAARADLLFAGVPIIAPSAIQLDSLPDFSAHVNGANAHIYGNVGEQLQDRIINSINFAQASAPGQPVYITETGISSSGYETSDWGVTDEDTQAVININALLDGYSAGAEMTFLYELMDEPNASNVQEQHFGLFNADGTPKLAATAIGNLTHLLADDVSGGAALGSLDYALTGLPGTASSMLLEKSDGTFELIVWNGRATLFDGTQEVAPPSASVSLSLGQAASSIRLYDPIAGSGAIASLANSSCLTFQLSADPIVIEMRFGTAPISSAAPSATNVQWLSANSAAISGSAEAGNRVSVYEGSTLLGTSITDSAGKWALTLPSFNASQHALTLSATPGSGPAVSSAGVTLYGKTKQTLVGGAGDDVLIGASGDRLTGGAGSDRFVLNVAPGKEVISDFHAATSAAAGDHLYVDHRLAATFDDVMAQAKQSGTSVVIGFDKSNVITLEHVDFYSLHSGDFFFF